ncbi:hypothetical protein ICN46_06125 [Polynucleobacter sp. Latsch14-2]|uniref:hypothetical protein n=1 Tax=Polynucleobacter sp. Latsch14-2 TaxID=2576920 RepID=UPI001C0E7608|nr:hypothetical protein [Polynucleobacter sp. Latsch14-2]MBU3614470.1 hypothetical protein [Polynucleobacter sp. Latsch14-2]
MSLPKLSGHSVLHKDRRWVVFGISQEYPYDGYEADCSVLVFDRRYDSVVAFVDDSFNGYCNPSTFQESLPVHGSGATELVESVSKALKQF